MTLLGALVGAGYAAIWSWALSSQTYNIYGSLAIVPIIIGVNLLLIARVVGRHPSESWLPGVLIAGLAAKTLGTFARYWSAYVLYAGASDAERYNAFASYQHKLWRQGTVVWDLDGSLGTPVMELITTAVYTVIGGAPLAGFFVFASFAFWGVYLLYRAFCIAVPHGDHKRYALLLFLLPSLLYWPSSIGKESWLMLFLGVTALGAAHLFDRRAHALPLLAVGGIGLAAVRPHIAVLVFASLFVAQLFRPTGRQATGLLSKVAGLAVIGVAAWVLTNQSAEFLGIEDLGATSVGQSLESSSARTEVGGSEFDPVPLSEPFGVPMAFITLLFRPFPFEAVNVQMLVQSLEGVFLVGLFLRSWRRLAQLPRLLRRHPYLVFGLVFIVAFTLAFAGFSNFGIVARQRVLMLPFFLMLLALPKPEGSGFDHLPVRHGELGAESGEDRRLMAIHR